jgi:hypothetical protein
MAPEKAGKPKPKRRWLQFSLRSLLIFTLICAIACAWLAHRMERKRREREAVEAIVKLRGLVLYDFQMVKGGAPPGPDWLRSLLGENFFSDVTMAGMYGTNLTDTDMANVEAWPRLRDLNLVATRITDAGLVHLKGLTELRSLSLAVTNVSDAGLENLEGLPQLGILNLYQTKVTDAGLVHLKRMTQLKGLSLAFTAVTDAGVEELQKALPRCRIDR